MCLTAFSGSYMLLDSSAGLPGDQVALFSPLWSFTKSSQLTFYYYMNSSAAKVAPILQVYVYTQLDAYEQLLFIDTTRHDNTWQNAAICLPDGNYRLAFVGTIGSSYMSDIALDKFTLTAAQSSCSAEIFTNIASSYFTLI
jgi:MAM domain, meprin/A5/mu